MKKWTVNEIAMIGNMLLQGPETVAFFQDLMKNQNEMIDFLEQTRPTAFRIHQESIENGK